MNVDDFRASFINDVKVAALNSGEGSSAEFSRLVAQSLIDGNDITEFNNAYYSGRYERKTCRVDGYAYDDLNNVMTLIITDYDGGSKRVISKTDANRLFDKLESFLHAALDTDIQDELEESTSIWDLVDILNKSQDKITKYNFYIFTDADKSQRLNDLPSRNIAGKNADCQVWDLARLYQIITAPLGRDEIVIDFHDYIGEGLPCLEASSSMNSECTSYLCVIPGKTLADIYDKYGGSLLESNVRVFLTTKKKINRAIRDTIYDNPSMFFAFNNGISAIAMGAEISNTNNGLKIEKIKDFQIINGGQTTASLSNARLKNKSATLDDVYVQMKLTIINYYDEFENYEAEYSDNYNIDNEAYNEVEEKLDGISDLDNEPTLQDRIQDLIFQISKASNSQNALSNSDFSSQHPFHVRMEQLSRRLLARAKPGQQYETRWFYERARGQYDQSRARLTPARAKLFTMKNPKEQLITKTDLAKVINSWNGKPAEVSKGSQNSFNIFSEAIESEWKVKEAYFNDLYFKKSAALVLLFRHLEKLIPKLPWYTSGYRANVVYYTMALLNHLLKKHFHGQDLNLLGIWNLQEIPKLLSETVADIASLVYKSITTSGVNIIANVSEWCKRPACWAEVKKIDFEFPENFESVLIDKEENKRDEKEARKDQKISSEVNVLTEVVKRSTAQWKQLQLFAIRNRLMTPLEDRALQIVCTKRVPTVSECKKILVLLEKAFDEGFEFQ